MTQSLNSAPQKQKFSVAINSKMYQNLIASTLRDPARARRFTAAITSAVAVNPALQECDAGTILAGALLGESLNLSPSPQLGQYYLVPFKQKAKYDRGGNMIRPETTTATFVLGYKGYIQLALRSGQYKDLDVMVIKQGEYMGKDPETGKAKFQFIEDDDERETLPAIGYMAYFEYLNGFRNLYRENDPDEMSDAWAVSLTDISYDAAMAGAVALSRTMKWPPTVAEICEAAKPYIGFQPDLLNVRVAIDAHEELNLPLPPWFYAAAQKYADKLPAAYQPAALLQGGLLNGK